MFPYSKRPTHNKRGAALAVLNGANTIVTATIFWARVGAAESLQTGEKLFIFTPVAKLLRCRYNSKQTPTTESLMSENQQKAQELFDSKYITSTEIVSDLRVSRTALLHARQRKILPEPITIRGLKICLWEREYVRPFVDEWKANLEIRREHKNA